MNRYSFVTIPRSTSFADFRYFSEAMVRRASFVIPSIVCLCLVGANLLHAGTTTSSDDNAVRQLRQFKTLLSLEVARGTNDPTLPGYFRKVAAAFQKVGYPGIGHVLELSGASSLQNLAGQFTGHITSLSNGDNFTARLKSAIGVAESANVPVRLDYLIAAKRFQGGFSSILSDLESRRASDAAAHWKGTGGMASSLNFTTAPSVHSDLTYISSNSTGYNPPTNSQNGAGYTVISYNAAVIDLTATIMLAGTASANGFSLYAGGELSLGTATVSSPVTWNDTTVDPSATLKISSGATIDISSGSTFKLLGTLSVDLAPSFVIPLTGTSTSTYDLESGSTLNVTNPAPGTYTILSGFQATGNTLGTVTITGLAAGQTGTLSQANGSVTLTITDASPTPSPTP